MYFSILSGFASMSFSSPMVGRVPRRSIEMRMRCCTGVMYCTSARSGAGGTGFSSAFFFSQPTSAASAVIRRIVLRFIVISGSVRRDRVDRRDGRVDAGPNERGDIPHFVTGKRVVRHLLLQ